MTMGKLALFDRICENKQYKDFLAFSTFMWLKKRTSAFNSALILLQRPGATYVETEETWKNEYNRAVRPDVTPIVVLRPFGPIDFLYDAADTYGDELPEEMKKTFVVPALRELKEYDFERFKILVKDLGIVYSEKPMGSRQGGFAKYLSKAIRMETYIKFKKVVFYTHYAVVVNSGYNEAAKASVILHEIGHVLCGHLGRDEYNDVTKVTDRSKENLSEQTKEFEAERVCEIVSNMLGIDCDAKHYLRDYLNPDGSEPSYSLRTTIEAADKIMLDLKKTIRPPKILKENAIDDIHLFFKNLMNVPANKK